MIRALDLVIQVYVRFARELENEAVEDAALTLASVAIFFARYVAVMGTYKIRRPLMSDAFGSLAQATRRMKKDQILAEGLSVARTLMLEGEYEAAATVLASTARRLDLLASGDPVVTDD